ncbi:hypothetical protein OZX38_005000 [Escherichia coli]|uniref:hypothetical protein n=1 Tax=Escherichia coli TaxID=562 RepID=UPI000BDF9E5C|nr:hypothetical protein [Escherichia coli]EKH5788026.1 hypothetical protein [Escherichia coli O8]EFB7208313.1 hypothetical protein [Escherichia coli]EFJ6679062.1 hypothetical protein [Escherichia coli]EFJ6706937.1 hypothetical protein [Escherichia coli]EFM2335356.1 hypothetical protein [Escherichia coli]
MKSIYSSLHLGIVHSLLFFMAVLVIIPQSDPVYPILIWFGMIILSGLIVQNNWNKKSSSQQAVRLRKNYKKTQDAALLSVFLFLLTIVSFNVIGYINTIIPYTLAFVTILCITYTISSHIKSFDNEEKNIAIKINLGIKYVWVIVSLISYYIARSLISNLFDIPFDATFNKLMTAVVALLFIFILYCIIYLVCIICLILMPSKVKKRKVTPTDDNNYLMSVFVPLFLIGCISYVAFSIHTLSIIKVGFGFAMKYDTRDTFFCRNKYMWLSEHPNARFMFIAEGNYRALIPHRDDFTTSRLTCTSSEPFYLLVRIQDKTDFMLEALEKQAAMLTSDLKIAISPNVR